MPSGRVADESRRDKIVEMYTAGMQRKQIAIELGITLTTVTNSLQARNIPLRPVYARPLTTEEERDVVLRYQAGEHRPALAAEFSVWPAAIADVLRRHAVPLRDDRGRRREYTTQEIEVVRMMAVEGASQHAIALAVNSSESSVLAVMKQQGIPAGWTGPMRLKNHYRWAGGRMRLTGGYIAIRLEPTDPLYVTADKKGYALEHRVVMGRSLGRPLEAYETVHHINGLKDDNRIENLQLRTGKHGNGVVHRCLDCGSHNVEAVKIAEKV